MTGPGSAHGRDRGSLSVVTMFLTIVALGAAGLVVDGGRALAARRHAAGTAEAAARFAITRQSLTTSFDSHAAMEVARSYAVRSGIADRDVAVEIRNRADGRPEIVVTITERPAAIVLGLAGVESLTVHATGSAIAVYAP